MAFLVCFMGLKVTVGLDFKVLTDDGQGEMKKMEFADRKNLDSEDDPFKKMAWGWQSPKYELEFSYIQYMPKYGSNGSPKATIIEVGDGAAAGNLGRMDLECIEIEFSEINENNDMVLKKKSKGKVESLSKNYEPDENFKGEYIQGETDVFMMAAKAKAWVAEKCAGEDDKIIWVKHWNDSDTKFGFEIEMMSSDQEKLLQKKLGEMEDADPMFSVENISYIDSLRLILV